MCPAGMSMAIIEALARAQHYLLIPEVTKMRHCISFGLTSIQRHFMCYLSDSLFYFIDFERDEY